MAKSALNVAPRKADLSVGINDNERSEIAELLTEILGDAYRLIVKTHIYHWNVAGPLFHAVHEMTEEQYNNQFAAVDELAERVRALGYRVPIQRDITPSIDGEDKAHELAAGEMIKDLIKSHEHLVRKMRSAAETAEQSNDFVSHDLLVGRMAYHEKVIWMWQSLVTE